MNLIRRNPDVKTWHAFVIGRSRSRAPAANLESRVPVGARSWLKDRMWAGQACRPNICGTGLRRVHRDRRILAPYKGKRLISAVDSCRRFVPASELLSLSNTVRYHIFQILSSLSDTILDFKAYFSYS